MRSRTLVCIIVMTLIIALSMARLAAQEQQEHPSYRIVDLGTLGGNFSFAFGINDRGWVDGFSTLPGDIALHAFIWHNGVMTDLGTLGGVNSQAFFGPNEKGQAAGLAETSTPDPNGEDFCGLGTHLICLPFVWQDEAMRPLRTLGGNNGQTDDINDRGQAVGWAEDSKPDPACPAPQVLHFHPVIWQKGEIQKFPMFPGDQDGIVLGINERGQAVGASGSCAAFDPDYGAPLQAQHALIWQDDTVIDLGNLGGKMNNVALVVDDVGQVGGTSGLPGDTAHHAFLWQDGVMSDLGTLPGDVNSGALGISKGRVVGVSFDASGNSRAYLWQNGVMTDLNTLISAASPLFLLQASAINSWGGIVGFALQTNTGDIHAFLAIPSHSREGIAPEVAGSLGGSPKVVLSENVRNLLQRQPRLRRLGSQSIAP